MNNIVVDMGGTRLKIGFLHNGKLIEHSVIPSCAQEGFKKTIDNIDSEIERLKQVHKISSIDGIGLTIPGIVDTKANRVLDINAKYSDSKKTDLNGWANSTWNARLVTENDARAALVGEWQIGAGKAIDNLVMITLGTGVGGAALIEGKLFHGKHFQAGCLGGHFTIDYQGRMCNCGNRGCVETVGSSWVLPKLALSEGYKKENVDFKMLFDDLRRGNEKAHRILHLCMNAWAACIVNLIHAYDPEMVIIGGGVMKSADIILPQIQSWVSKYAWTPWGDVSIVRAQLEDTAALYGMNHLLKI